MQDLQQDPVTWPHYSIHQGHPFCRGKPLLSTSSQFIPTLLHEFHDLVVRGQSGLLQTYLWLTKNVLGEGWSTVCIYVTACEIYQKNKSEALMPIGLLQPLSIPEKIWADVTLDFIEGLPNSGGFNAILVVVDRLSKYAHFSTIKHLFTI